MASKWNLIIDVARCDNCRVCFLAVKDEYVGNDFPGYSAAQPAQGHNWLDIRRKERGAYPLVEARFMPVMCNHCDDAPCLKAARDGAVRKRSDGIVIIDPEKSRGQRQIVAACPYGVVCWNEERQVPQAWPFDAHLLDQGWSRTRAEQACPSHAFRTIKVEDEEMRRIQADEGLEVLQPALGTRPRLYYKNLRLITKCFVGGTVVTRAGGMEECAAGTAVVLSKDGREVGRATTDAFGEFKIDGLEPNSAGYSLEASAPAGHCSARFDLGDESRYLGVLTLAAGAYT
jgi:Fe-S-cluster-containing dehydrogenase component